MSAHTPGPWKVEKGRDRTHPYSVTGDEFDLARCVTVDDAALIAAAPDLLDALREVMSTYAATTMDAQVRDRAIAAIAKAEGGEA